MALRIADSCPKPPLLRRLGRGVLFLVGALVLLAGLVAAAPPLLFAVLVVLDLLFGGGEGSGSTEPGAWGGLALLAVGAVGALVLATRLLRGRRRLVLFLRRFGFEDSSRALTYAVGTAVGRRWRVATLDDARLAPLGVEASVRRTLRWGRWLGVLLVVAGVVYVLLWVQGPGPGAIMEDLYHQGVEGAPEGTNALEAAIGALLGALFGGIVIVVLIVVLLLLNVAFVGGATLLTWGSDRAVERAERSKVREIREAGEVEAVTRRVARHSRRLFAPRLVVVRVATARWRRAVRELAACAAVILIDVSEPTENLLWEVETLEEEVEAPWLLVGRRDRLEALARGGDGELGRRLARLLDGEEALAYEAGERRSLKRFAAALRSRLERVAG